MTPLMIVLGVAVVAAVVVLGRHSLGGKVARSTADDYQHALELWIAGDHEEAIDVLSRVVQADPHAIDPYLTLGNLLRRRGDAARAAVLHRGLTVRADLPREKKVAVGLALAADLVALERWEDARTVLDELVKDATGRAAYWRLRFAQRHGQGNRPEAARALKSALRFVPARDADWFERAYASYQLDRALAHARRGDTGEARARLKDVEKLPVAATRAALVRAVLAAATGDAAAAIAESSANLLDNPEELSIFLPQLQDVLLASGHYARSIPLLERACQAESAPPQLWISLALLYEKLDQRDKALRLLEAKAGHPAFTPDAAAAYLRVLMREAQGTDVARVWALLAKPAQRGGWRCADSGNREDQLRWFCPACRGFETVRRQRQEA